VKFDAATDLYVRHSAGEPWLTRVRTEQQPPHRAPVALRATYSRGLSRREVEVLRLIAAGRTNHQISDELFISVHTVGRHVSNIFAKTGVANRAEAATYGHRHGLT
jgi:DNA-binding NarL/FixJ family response regulator